MSLKISTLNVCRGMREQYKNDFIHMRYKTLGFDIIFLQELRISFKSEKRKLEKQWEGKLFCSYGDNKSNRGVGIFINNLLDYKFISCKSDFEGRVVCVDINLGEYSLRFINVYAPNDAVERKQFISRIDTFLITSRQVICGGDWNFIENADLDKLGGNLDRGLYGKEEIKSLKQSFHLQDPYRALYPKKKEYTWRGGPVHCRLDRFYISVSLLPLVEKMQITPCMVSDHYYVDLIFKPFDSETQKFGPGYWKLNDSIIKEKNVQNDLITLWE